MNSPEQDLRHCRHDAPGDAGAGDDPVWGPAGLLAAALPGWRARAGQRALADAVRQAIEQRSILLAEAGTGTGKTLAYLVPALLHGERVVVSTATRALQDQLSRKDLPLACQALGLQVRSTVLKGRANYVCLYRLARAQQDGLLDSRRAVQQLREVARFAAASNDGDLSGMAGLDEQSPLLPLVTSTRDNCLGSECPDFRKCFVMKARREALAADVVVVNHHLFFADLALRGDGVAELLPAATTVVLDEAHQLADIGAQFLGSAIGTAQAQELARDAQACGLQHARGLADWPVLGAALLKAARDARLCAGPGAQRLDWAQAQALPGWEQALRTWRERLESMLSALSHVEDAAPEFSRLAERCREQQRLLSTWQLGPDDAAGAPGAVDSVRWLEVGSHHLRLLATPLGIGPAFSALLAERSQAWVLVSATLTVDGSFRYTRARLGLGEHSAALQPRPESEAPRLQELRVASPFDYAAQTRLLVPRRGFHPGDAEHSLRVAELAARLIEVNPGGSFVLTTTLRAMGRIAERLRELLPPGRSVLEQSSEPKAVLLRRFGADPRAVLVGSHSFWEGVDFPGDQLTLVVIDKLPFAPPDDPMVAARLARLEAAGRSGFMDYSLPQAALALQQGAGRLVRGEQDWGVLAVCDQRLVATGWGRRVLASLPSFTPVDAVEQAVEFLREHAQLRGE
ncbi:MAG: ATP-dependent DNA helicase [Betaproteobacteria bacterium]|nr:ATP-dependent DNA helicase [Betaproteobacteria bacterium]